LSDEPVFPYAYGEVGAIQQPPAADSEIPEEISNRLDHFFATSIAPPSALVSSSLEETGSATFAVPPDVALQGVNVDKDFDDEEGQDAPAGLADWHDESKKEPAPALADVDTPEMKQDEGGAGGEFSPASESEPALSFLADDEPDESEYDEFGEIVPALSSFDDSDLPKQSEFAEENDEAVMALENEEILTFFQDKPSDAGEEEKPFPTQVEKPETPEVDELELLQVPQQLGDEARHNLVAFLTEDVMPGQTPAAVGEIDVDQAEQDDIIAFCSDDVPEPAAATPVADKNAESEAFAGDETQMLVNDFFADKSDRISTFAESVAEPSATEIVYPDAVAETSLVREREHSRAADIDLDDAPRFEEDFSADAELPGDPLSFPKDISLDECVNALADEINDDILDQSYRQVRRLRTELSNQPLAEIYLQFISAIMQHIDQRRAEASDEALPLLRQTLAHLEESQRNDESENIQRSLLDDAQAVLSWQQSLLQEHGPVARSWL
jgi:hypothetical protein